MKYEKFKTMMQDDREKREFMAAPEEETDWTFEDIRDRVFYRIDSYKGNESKLMHCPFVPFHDMVITFRWLYEESDEGICSALIENEHLDYWGITEEDVIRQAAVNTPKLFPAKSGRLVDMLFEPVEEAVKDYPIHILSNVVGINGASVVLYEGTLKSCYDAVGEDFYLLPSSIHEMLVIGKKYVFDPADLYEMVHEANSTVVSERDFLSESVFFYDHRKDEMTVVPK